MHPNALTHGLSVRPMMDLLQTQTFTDLNSWRSVVASRMRPFSISPRARTDFFTQARLLETSGVQFWDIAASPQLLERSQSQIAHSRAALTLTVQLEGEGDFSQQGRHATLRPGEFAFLDWSAPHTRSFYSENRIIVMPFSAEALPKYLRVSEELLARRLTENDEMSRHLPDMISVLLRLWDASASASDRVVLLSALHTVEQMAVRILTSAEASPRERGGPSLSEVQHHILQRLTDPELSPAGIARSHHVSVRQLYKLFEAEGLTVAAWIRRQRLMRMRDELVDPDVNVADLGTRWALGGPSQVTRAFTREFGMSPTQFRDSFR